MSEDPTTRTLRPLVVGAGNMGHLHVRTLLARPDVDELTLVDPDPVRSESLARRYGRIRAHGDLAAVPDMSEHDFAIVAVPIRIAPEVIETLLAGGLPVLAEKPLAPSAEAALALLERVERHGGLLSVGYIERCNPAVEALREELARGTGGEIYHVHARRLSPFPYRAGMTGVALDVATHDLDVAAFVMGSLPTRVYAETAVRQGTSGEDQLCASLRYENLATGLIESNWVSPTKVRRLTVTTERGMFDLDYITQDLWFHERADRDTDWDALGVIRGANEGRTIRFALNRREPLSIEHERFIAAALSGGEPPVPATDAIDTLRTAEAIIESGRTQQPVTPVFARRARGA